MNVRHRLLPDEQLIASRRVFWGVYILDALLLLIGALSLLGIFWSRRGIVFLVIAGGLTFLVGVMRFLNNCGTELAVTTQRVILKQGFLGGVVEMPLCSVEKVEARIDRYLNLNEWGVNSGSLILDGEIDQAGRKQIETPRIVDPAEFRSQILFAMDALRDEWELDSGLALIH